jgi:hypothetical protein
MGSFRSCCEPRPGGETVTIHDPIDAYLAELTARLGWRRSAGARALIELRDHLECATQRFRAEGMTEKDAQLAALDALGPIDEVLRMVIETSGGSKMTKDRVLLIATFLMLPGIVLLGLSFLVFNFPCSTVLVESGSGSFAWENCGVSFLQSLRPWLSDFGYYGSAPWYAVTQAAVTTLGPLIGAVLLFSAQTDFRLDRQDGATATIVFKPVAHRMVALMVSTIVFISVAAYKLAG